MSGALSFLGTVSGAARSVATIAGSAADAASAVAGLLGLPAAFYSLLQPASFRGLPFAVMGSRVRAGRRKARHEYPFRDGTWVEDLGKMGRLYAFEGFVVGDDAGARIKAITEAAEAPGIADLVHPTFGSLQVEVVEFEASEQWDEGRVWRFRAEFLEPVARGLQLLPSSLANTQGAVASAAADAKDAVSGSFAGQIAAGIGKGVAGVQAAISAVQPYVQTATRLVGDASRIAGAVSGLAGSFGRYSAGSGVAYSSNPLRTVAQVTSAVSSTLSTVNIARGSVASAASALSRLVAL